MNAEVIADLAEAIVDDLIEGWPKAKKMDRETMMRDVRMAIRRSPSLDSEEIGARLERAGWESTPELFEIIDNAISDFDIDEEEEAEMEMLAELADWLEEHRDVRVTLKGRFVAGTIRNVDLDQENVTVDVDGKPYIYDLWEFAPNSEGILAQKGCLL